MINPFKSITERLSSNEPIVEAQEAKISKSQYFRERPESVTFKQLIEYHDRTPQLQIAVSSYAELITGTEMTVKAKNKDTQKIIDDWMIQTNFYDKFKALVSTLLICGNAILEKIDEGKIEDVQEVDMVTIIGKIRDEWGKLDYYEHRNQDGKTENLGEGKLGKFIEFNLTSFSRQAWGRSLFYSLAVPRRVGIRYTPPPVELLWSIEDAMGGIMLNMAYPINTITYPGASDTFLKKESQRWEKYKPGDRRIQKIKPEIEFFEAGSSAGRYEFIVNHIEKMFEIGTQFPHDIMTGDFTSRASSETTENIVMKKVRGYQRYLGNKLVQELFNPLITQNGKDPEGEELEVSFTTQEIIKLQPQDVANRVEKKLWTVNEGREWDRTNLGVELPDDAQLEQEKEEEKQAQEEEKQMMLAKNNDKDNKVNNLQKKVEKLISEHALTRENEKLREQMERKIELIREALDKNKEELAEKRTQALEKIIKKVEDLG